ncbi:hypothetical protein NEOLEDRAFT_1171367 [Neolentinus lepideus HHB14362 ss-1]|uniref:Uncharacterized protein n=1 Tax=Neolentinus lepideus HHB14362 ss-1 TaxID=1314782 RepID=A0A165QF32_9AGAM|nr:hypothetical protein NEOLEDRAFT_1171367 [Neolentinus lepideus HHB14362 ss-1]
MHQISPGHVCSAQCSCRDLGVGSLAFESVAMNNSRHQASTPPKEMSLSVSHSMDIPVIARYVIDQDVEVRIKANVWVVGAIVGLCKLFNKVTGMAYEVEYRTPYGYDRGRFAVGDIRPRI